MTDVRRSSIYRSRLLLAVGGVLILLSIPLSVTFSLEEPDGSGYDLLLGRGEIWFGLLTFIPRGPTLLYWCSLGLAGVTLTTLGSFTGQSRALQHLQTASRLMFLFLSLDCLVFATGVTAVAVQKAFDLKPVWLFWGSLLVSFSLLLLLALRFRLQRRKKFCYAGLAMMNALYVFLTFLAGLALWGFPALYAGVGLIALGYRQTSETATVVSGFGKAGGTIVKVVTMLGLVMLLAGCLRNEETEIRILRERGEPAIAELEQINFYSDETEPAKIREDFDRLIEGWRGSGGVDSSAKEGVSIKGRDLFVRDGKIVLRQTAILQTLESVGTEIRVDSSQIVWVVDTNGGDVVETNGTVVSKDPPTISWPRNAPLLRVRIREDLSETYKTTHPAFLRMLNEYMASQPK